MLRSLDPNEILILGTVVVLLLSLASLLIGRRGLAADKAVREIEEPEQATNTEEPLLPTEGREALALYMEDIAHMLREPVLEVSYSILGNWEAAQDNAFHTFVTLYVQLSADAKQIGQLTRSEVLRTAGSLGIKRLQAT